MNPSLLSKILIILNIFCLGCSNNKESIIKFKDFPIEYNIQSKPLIPLYTPGAQLELYDTLLFVDNLYDNSYFIRIYNINSLKLYRRLLRKGNGPHELNRIGNISIDLKNHSLWVADYPHNNLWGYNIDSLIEKNSEIPFKIVHLPAKVFPIVEFHCRDSLIYLPDLVGGTGIIIFNGDGMEINRITNTDLSDQKNLIGTDFNMTLSNIITSENKIITAYRYFDKLVIRDIDGDNYKVVIGPDQINIKDQLKGDKFTRKECYFPYYPRADNNFIYAEYNGNPGFIINKNLGSQEAAYGSKINIFTWQGEPIARLNLDHQLISFVIDSVQNRIIAFDYNTDTTIVEYDIDKILIELKKKLYNETK